MSKQSVTDPDEFVTIPLHADPLHAEILVPLLRSAEDKSFSAGFKAQVIPSATTEAMARREADEAEEAMLATLSILSHGARVYALLKDHPSCNPEAMAAARRNFDRIVQAFVDAHNASRAARKACRRKFGDEAQ